MRTVVVLGAAGLVASCSAAPITCQTGADCEAKWSRAISWLTTHSQLKIQTQSDYLIQTYNSIDASTSLAFTITRVATGQPGIYQISFAAGCDNFIGCFPTPEEARAGFAAFVDPARRAQGRGRRQRRRQPCVARKDHRRIAGNPALEQKTAADRQACNAQAASKGQSGDPAFEATYKVCMDGRGYVMLPLAEAQKLAR